MITFYVGNQPDPKDRTKIKVGKTSEARILALKKNQSALIYDCVTHKFVSVRRANCGLGCWCALEFNDPAHRLPRR